MYLKFPWTVSKINNNSICTGPKKNTYVVGDRRDFFTRDKYIVFKNVVLNKCYVRLVYKKNA